VEREPRGTTRRALAAAVGVLVILLGPALAGRAGRARAVEDRGAPLILNARAIRAPVATAAGGAPVRASSLDDTWEVTVDAPGAVSGRLYAVDAEGHPLAPPSVFERVLPTSSALQALVPLRSLAPHEGETRVVALVAAARCFDGEDVPLYVGRAVREMAAGCRPRVAGLSLATPPAAPFDPGVLDAAARALRDGDPAEALAMVDEVRGSVYGQDAARADALGAEAAYALGRGELAGRLATRGTRETSDPTLAARLLRTSTVVRAEAMAALADATWELPERDALARTAPLRPGLAEELLDRILDLKVAFAHDTIWLPEMSPAAAHSVVDVASRASEEELGVAAGLVCYAARFDGRSSPAAAAAMLDRGERAARRREAAVDEATCEMSAADRARDAGHLDESAARYQRAIDLLAHRPMPREQREAHFSAALLSAKTGRYPEAFERARDAYAWVDFALGLQSSMTERDALLSFALAYYGVAERFAIQAGDAAAGVAAAEWGKGRAFEALLQDQGEVAVAGDVAVVSLNAAAAPARSLDALARTLSPGDAAVSYTILGPNDAGRKEIAVGVVTRDGVSARLVEKPSDLCKQVRSFAAHVQASEEAEAKAAGTRLDAVLIAPIRDLLAGKRRVFISPHLCLHGLPWAALYDGQQFLVESFSIARVVPLLAASREPRDEQPLFARGQGHAWMLASGALAPGEAPLPGLASLARELAGRVDASLVLSGADVTPERFLTGATGVNALFFGGHAKYDDDAPLRSALLVSPSAATGLDRVEARAVLELDHTLDLAILLGCETSRLWKAHPSFGDDAMGLQRAFLAGGARHVVGALWPVLDRDAEDFVRALVDEGAARDVVSAVGAAQRCLAAGRCKSRGIAAWASFLVDAR
jgi:CHAT domain-containing protein